MASENTTPSASNDDDSNLDELLRGIIDASPDLQSQLASQDEADKYDELALEREQEIVTFLKDKLPAIDNLEEIMASLGDIKDDMSLMDVHRALVDAWDKLREMNAPDDMAAPIIHMRAIVGEILVIASASISSETTDTTVKKETQTRILTSDSLLPEEKQALIEAANQFIKGEALDTENPSEVVEAFSQNEKEKKQVEENSKLRAEISPLFDEMVGDFNSANTDDIAYQNLKQYATTAILVGEPALFQDMVEDCLDQLGIDYGDYYDAIDEIVSTISHTED